MTVKHGSLSMATNYGCSCGPCRDAQTRYVKRWRLARARGAKFMVPSAPSVRKLQALARLGHTFSDIAREAGYSGPAAITNLMKRDVIRSATEVRIEEVYRHLEMKIPYMTHHRRLVQQRAIDEGWLPPLAYDDIDLGIVAEVESTAEVPPGRFDLEVVEDFLQYGTWKRRTSRLEKIEIMRRWLADGRSENELCRLTGWRAGRYGRGFQHELEEARHGPAALDVRRGDLAS